MVHVERCNPAPCLSIMIPLKSIKAYPISEPNGLKNSWDRENFQLIDKIIRKISHTFGVCMEPEWS